MSRFRFLLLTPVLGISFLGGMTLARAQTVVENAVYAVDQAMRNYNLIAFGNASFSNNYGDTEGGLAVQGNLYVNGGAIATRPELYGLTADPTLYVTGNLTLGSNTTYVSNGYASIAPSTTGTWTEGNRRLSGVNGGSGTLETHGSSPNATIDPRSNAAPAGWDWLSMKTTFEQASATLAAATPTGSISVGNGQALTFSANGQTSGVVVFTLDMADFSSNSVYQGSSVSQVRVDVPNDVTYVVNVVNATNTSVFEGLNFNAGQNNDQLLWNITPSNNPGLGSSISLGGNNRDFFGSILAPSMNISNNSSRITGQVVANNYTHTGVELHYISFDSTVSFSPVPEPNAWGLSAMATAFLAILRRPRRSSAPLAA